MIRGFSVALAVCVLLSAVEASNAFASGKKHHDQAHHAVKVHHHRGAHHHGLSWHEHDRVVYAVSTLNAPLCSNGKQLSAVLSGNGAHFFDVDRSLLDQRLYYVVVRTATESLVGVYAYRFGWKLPDGVLNSRCVAAANSGLAAGFKSRDWKWEAQFTSTFPQS